MHLFGRTGLAQGSVYEPSHAAAQKAARYKQLEYFRPVSAHHGLARFTCLLHFSFTLTAEKTDNPFDKSRIRDTVRRKATAEPV